MGAEEEIEEMLIIHTEYVYMMTMDGQDSVRTAHTVRMDDEMDIQSMENVKMVDRDSQESMVMEHSVEVDEMMDIWVNEMVEVMAKGRRPRSW